MTKRPTSKGRSIISAFTEDQVEKLTGITISKLRYWDGTGFFSPGIYRSEVQEWYGRIYSFRDIVSLKVLNDLRNKAKVPLPQLRELKDQWSDMRDDIWSNQTLYALNKRVIKEGDVGYEDVLSHQHVMHIPIRAESEKMQNNISKLFKRDRSTIGKITKQRNIAHNKHVIAGTRVKVQSVKAFSNAGYSISEIKSEYPNLTKKDIDVAIRFKETA